MVWNTPTPRALRRKAMAEAYFATIEGEPTTPRMAGFFLEQKLHARGYRVIGANSPTQAMRRQWIAEAFFATQAGEPTDQRMAASFLEKSLHALGCRVIQLNRRDADFQEEPAQAQQARVS